MIRLFSLFALSLYLVNGSKDRVLVILNDNSYKTTHSNFFETLEKMDFQLEYTKSDNSSLRIQKFKEYLFDHILMFASNTEEFGGLVNSKILASFIDSGRNILMTIGSKNGQAIREFAAACGIKVNSEYKQLDSLELSKDNILQVDVITGNASNLIYNGPSIEYIDEMKNNEFITPILSSDASSLYGLVMQARNNARLGFLTSSDLFNNDVFMQNSQFTTRLVQWTFQKSGRLRTLNHKHHLLNENIQKSFYTIRQRLHFEIKLEQEIDQKWVPLCVDNMQLEFVRIDPFVRQTLKCKQDGLHYVDFEIPDVHGVYKFVIEYEMPGFSKISFSELISIHPLRHDEYERFIRSASPYYLVSFSMMVGAFVLTFVLMYFHQDVKLGKKNN